ncbi:sensor histidine kinase [Cohnella endophytica]|uniref:histidine kinase n=1 Tax=Cohnella endophytica TaxID=2419778 RepID=A0A494Y4F0_9BACL|nr:sensor histidine kinase [Cohnella endophytica]RKP55156.1 sensor histidine kinase [Cohnella endophytica]
MKPFMRYFKNLRFKHKLFLSYSLVVVIPIMILGIYSFERAKFALEVQVENKWRVSLTQSASNIDNKVKQYESVADFIGINKRIQRILKNDYSDMFLLYDDMTHYLGPTLSDILYLNGDIDKIMIYCNKDIPEYGQFTRSSARVSDSSWFKEALTKPSLYDDGGRVFAVRKIVSINNSATDLGVLYMEINVGKLLQGLAESITDQYGITVLDKHGNTVYARNTFIDSKYALNGSELPDTISHKMTFNGETYRFIRSEMPESGWSIYFYTPQKLMPVHGRDIIEATVLIAGICLVVLILIIWLFSNTFVKRIAWLNRMMLRVQNGDLQVEVSSDSSDEIGELINRFRVMLKRINNLIDDVYRSEITQKEAEFKALQAQINPHFLYNALSLINWKAKMIHAKDISDIANSISRFYRTTLNNGKNVISIRDELRNTQAYLEIQSVMHDNGFEVRYDVEEEIYSYDMIKLILQPIVENAIHHGIERMIEGRGLIVISGRLEGDSIEFLVSDNGPGMEQDVIDGIFVKQSVGYGLLNVHNRIRLFFGNAYGISIASDVGEGTIVKLQLPKFNNVSGY